MNLSQYLQWQNTWVKNPEEKSKIQKQQEILLSIESQGTSGDFANGDYSNKVIVSTLPIVGRVHILLNKQGFFTVGFIIFYWIYGTWSTIFLLLKPRYNDGVVSELPIIFYGAVAVLCITSLFRAVTSNPGRVPFIKNEQDSGSDIPPELYCNACQRPRPLRSHHCRRCGQCILRMDHHCPWINNCVGEGNHYLFMQLLTYASLMGATTLIICLLHIYYWPTCISCPKEDGFSGAHPTAFMVLTGSMAFWMFFFATVMLCSHLGNWMTEDGFSGAHPTAFMVLTGAMAFWMFFFATLMLCNHLANWMTDMTTIDWLKWQSDWAKRKTLHREDIPTVKKSLLQSMDDMCGPGSRLMWPFPCRRRHGPIRITYPEII